MSAVTAASAESGHGILTGMSTRPRSPAGDPMTLGNMRANGVRSLAGHLPSVPAAITTRLRATATANGPSAASTKCGTIGADVRPDWRERAR